jgi:hypothetical protein
MLLTHFGCIHLELLSRGMFIYQQCINKSKNSKSARGRIYKGIESKYKSTNWIHLQSTTGAGTGPSLQCLFSANTAKLIEALSPLGDQVGKQILQTGPEREGVCDSNHSCQDCDDEPTLLFDVNEIVQDEIAESAGSKAYKDKDQRVVANHLPRNPVLKGCTR